MPHFPAINIRSNGFTILLELYKNLFNNKKQLIKDGKIVWANFKLFIGKIAENEEMFLKEIYPYIYLSMIFVIISFLLILGIFILLMRNKMLIKSPLGIFKLS